MVLFLSPPGCTFPPTFLPNCRCHASKGLRRETYTKGLVWVGGMLCVGSLALRDELWAMVVSGKASLTTFGPETQSLRRAHRCPSDRLHVVQWESRGVRLVILNVCTRSRR